MYCVAHLVHFCRMSGSVVLKDHLNKFFFSLLLSLLSLWEIKDDLTVTCVWVSLRLFFFFLPYGLFVYFYYYYYFYLKSFMNCSHYTWKDKLYLSKYLLRKPAHTETSNVKWTLWKRRHLWSAALLNFSAKWGIKGSRVEQNYTRHSPDPL